MIKLTTHRLDIVYRQVKSLHITLSLMTHLISRQAKKVEVLNITPRMYDRQDHKYLSFILSLNVHVNLELSSGLEMCLVISISDID